MKMKEINQRIGIVLASAIVLITVFALAVTITPASAQENREIIPGGVFENRHLNRPIEIDGDLIIEGNVGPDGNITGQGDLEVGENVNGIVNINGDIEIGGTVESNADISVAGNVSIGGSISPGANLSLETPGTTLNVEAGMKGGSIKVSAGDVEINIGENLESGNISLTGENSRVNIAGSSGQDSTIDGVPSVNVSKNVSGEIDVARSVSVGENLREEGRLVSEDNIEVSKSVSGEVRSRNNISIGENLREGGSVTLETPGKTLEIGGAMEGDATVTENADVSIGEVPAGNPVDVSVDASPLDGINISVQNTTTNLNIEISNLENDVETDIDTPEDAVYNYQEIDTTATEEEIDEAKLNANVERSWLEDQGIDADSVRINRYHDGEWVELPTDVVDENATHIEVEAETPGFSTFSITQAQENRGKIPGGVFENRHLNRPVEVDGDLTIEGNVGPNGSINGKGDLQVGENVNGIVDIAGRVRVDGNIQSNARITATDDIEVGRSVSGEVRSRNNISIGEDLKEEGSATLETPGKTLEIGGAMEGDATVTENASVSIGQVPVNVPVDVSVEASPLDGVSISVQNEITDLDIEISNLEGDVETDIDTPEGAVYNYQEIDANVTEEEIDEARLNANVERSWLEEQGIDADSVRINRYHDGEWVELPTDVVDENATHVEVEAETPGFSTFSITGVESVEEPDEGLPLMLIGGIIIVVAIIAVAGALVLRK